MKRQILFITITVSTVTFFSCSKQNAGLNEVQASVPQQSNTPVITPEMGIYINPVTNKLAGAFLFNGDLKDSTGKLPDGTMYPILRGGVAYTTGHKGYLNSALNLTGYYSVFLANVPQQANTSISLWVKRAAQYSAAEIITPNGRGPAAYQFNYAFQGDVFTSQYTPYVNSGAYIDQAWHHIVVTYDGTYLKLYIDGNLVGTSNNPETFISTLVYYRIGLMTGGTNWKGYVDDLRFYSRTLTANDVKILYNL